MRTIIAIVLFAAAAMAWGWGEKGHRLINHAAVKGMPKSTPAFFLKAIDRIAYLGPEPDRWRNQLNDPFDDNFDQLFEWNAPDHFMDMEYAAGIDFGKPMRTDAKSAPRVSRYNYLRAIEANVKRLHEEGKMKGLNLATFRAESVGFLPYRIAELSEMLRKLWHRWRVPNLPATEKRQIEENIIYTAGVLGHYVGDGSNPHHTTIHYNGWDASLEPNPGGFTPKGRTSKNMHRRFEDDMVDARIDAAQVAKIEAAVAAAAVVKQFRPFDDAYAYLKTSNGRLHRLYELDKAEPLGTANKSAEALSFVRERLAAGAEMARDIWVWAMQR